MEKRKPKIKSDLDRIEKDIDSLIEKHRDKNFPAGTTLVSQSTEAIQNMPEEGFYFVLLSKRGEKISLRQFGRNITTDHLITGFARVITDVSKDLINPNIGRA